jgi:apolipoprotein N-acyltransferase
MRVSRTKGASLFINLTNDNYYPFSRLPKQHFDHARLRTVENGVPLVRACNTGITAAIDSLGRVKGELEELDGNKKLQAGVLALSLPLYHYKTLYTYWGDGCLLAICFLSLAFSFLFKIKRSDNFSKD